MFSFKRTEDDDGMDAFPDDFNYDALVKVDSEQIAQHLRRARKYIYDGVLRALEEREYEFLAHSDVIKALTERQRQELSKELTARFGDRFRLDGYDLEISL